MAYMIKCFLTEFGWARQDNIWPLYVMTLSQMFSCLAQLNSVNKLIVSHPKEITVAWSQNGLIPHQLSQLLLLMCLMFSVGKFLLVLLVVTCVF